VNPWLYIIVVSISGFTGGFLSSWILNTWETRRWRRWQEELQRKEER
jgi:preprotein translocase subunit SecF